MATAKQKAWREKFARMYGGGRKKASRKTKRGGVMARRRGRRSGRGGSSMGGLLSQKNIIGTLGGAYIAPMAGLDPKIGAAAGSFLYGKKGIMGAAVGYFVAPMVLSMIPQLGGTKVSGAQIFY